MTGKKPIMMCGHAANAKDERGKYCCAICFPSPNSMIIDRNKLDLTGRFAHCAYGKHSRVPSSVDLAFFEYRPDEPEDIYYCGCYGWD